MLRGHKGDYVQVLFVCTHGISRSATAAELGVKLFGWNTRSCGARQMQALIPLNVDLIQWADRIYCFEDWHVDVIVKHGAKPNKVVNLQIPDEFDFREEKLVEILRHKLVKDETTKP